MICISFSLFTQCCLRANIRCDLSRQIPRGDFRIYLMHEHVAEVEDHIRQQAREVFPGFRLLI